MCSGLMACNCGPVSPAILSAASALTSGPVGARTGSANPGSAAELAGSSRLMIFPLAGSKTALPRSGAGGHVAAVGVSAAIFSVGGVSPVTAGVSLPTTSATGGGGASACAGASQNSSAGRKITCGRFCVDPPGATASSLRVNPPTKLPSGSIIRQPWTSFHGMLPSIAVSSTRAMLSLTGRPIASNSVGT